MKQFLLAFLLIAAPVAAFSTFQIYLVPAAVKAASLGDLSALKAIVADTQNITKTGDTKAAEKRITDFETMWDEAEDKMRPLNETAWGVVDGAADKALHALRDDAPDATKVDTAVAGLISALENPNSGVAAPRSVSMFAGIAVTDANGHAIPCETMLSQFRDSITQAKIPTDKMTAAAELMTKATERCNADDDVHADEFSAQGLALATK
jgi:hypothetical protein